MNNIASRIKYALDYRKMKPKDLSELTGISRSSISEWLAGKYEPKQDKIFIIAEALKIDEGWLLGLNVPIERQADINEIYNKLKPPRQKIVYKCAQKQLEKQKALPNITDCKEEKHIVHINGLLTAGHGSINFDKEQPFASVTVEYAPKDYDLAFEIAGDSMFPTFQDGEIVFVQRLQAIYNGMLAAVEINNEAFVKKVYLEGNRIRLVSLNTDLNDLGERLYPDFYADEKDDIHMIGRVLT